MTTIAIQTKADVEYIRYFLERKAREYGDGQGMKMIITITVEEVA